MKKLSLTLIMVLVILLSACSAKTGDTDQARKAINDFYDRLSSGDYAGAAQLYGGSYETLVSFNPDLNPSDTAALWQNGCQINGLQCLKVRSAKLLQQSGGVFEFMVEFNNKDGSLFVQGPCCGADETQTPPISLFQVRVEKTPQGKFLVVDMPVYLP